jgi:spore germination protein
MSRKLRSLFSRQVTMMILGLTIGAGILTLPSAVARVFGASSWIGTLIIGLFFTGGSYVAAKLAQMFPEETIVEYSQKILGKYFGIIFSILFAVFFFSFVPIETRIMHELVNISLLPQAPSWFVNGVFILVMAYAASKDITQLAQVNELLIEIALVVGVFVSILAWQHFKPMHMLPVFAKNQLHFEQIGAEIGTAFSYAGFPLVNMILPYIRNPEEVTRATIKGNLLVTLIYTFFTITVIGVFGYKETIDLAWPGLELAKSVNLEAVILERLDLILLISWISAVFTTGVLAYFVAALVISKLFGLRNHTFVVWAMVPLIYYLSTSLKNYFVWNQWGLYISILAIIISFLLIPLLYFLALIKARRRN